MKMVVYGTHSILVLIYLTSNFPFGIITNVQSNGKINILFIDLQLHYIISIILPRQIAFSKSYYFSHYTNNMRKYR